MHHCKPPYPTKFKPGMIAVCNTEIKFTDGTKHSKFQQIEVTEKDVSYFNVNYAFYDVKSYQS